MSFESKKEPIRYIKNEDIEIPNTRKRHLTPNENRVDLVKMSRSSRVKLIMEGKLWRVSVLRKEEDDMKVL